MRAWELARELDGLARALRAMTPEAALAVATALKLERQSTGADLTVGHISRAVTAATRQPATSVELRRDVYTRRIDRHAQLFAERLTAAILRGAPAPAGERFAPRFTSLPAGTRSIYDAVPTGTTAINADVSAWIAAARGALVRIVPAYGRDAVDRYIDRAFDGAGFEAICRLRDVIFGAIEQWLDTHTILLGEVDAAGRLTRINGVDPAPFIALRAGSAGDPIGILTTATAAVPAR